MARNSDRKAGEVLKWNPVFAEATQRMGLGVDLCWPARPNQKGSVEILVGWAKGSFFKVRQFHDRADLQAQLADWLVEINERRRCRATGRVPAELLAEERPRLSPSELALRLPVSAKADGDRDPYQRDLGTATLPSTT